MFFTLFNLKYILDYLDTHVKKKIKIREWVKKKREEEDENDDIET